MIIRIEPTHLSGRIDAIPSKSDAHRILIAAFLSDEKNDILLQSSSKDIDATIECIKALGAKVEKKGNHLIVEKGSLPKEAVLNCNESGSTFRFLVPVASAICEKVSFNGGGRLPERPIKDLLDALRSNGTIFSSDTLPFTKTGKLSSGVFELPGNVSSQYITGLLLALPLLDKSSEIRLTTALESAPYVDITINTLNRFGIEIERRSNSFYVKGNQKYKSPKVITIDGDWSNSSYFLAAGLIGDKVSVNGLDVNSPQGDKEIIKIFERLGGKVEIGEGITTFPSRLKGCEIDVSEIPDMFPTLAVLATAAEGKTKFVGTARLRAKESDRIKTTASLITSLGGKVNILDDGVEIEGSRLTGGCVDAENDHRIVMATALASILCSEEVTINKAEAVAKSYPSFFEDFKKLGGKCNVI